MKGDDIRPKTALVVMALCTLISCRVWAATTVEWGDSEALYACYRYSPQWSFRDHPGMIGDFGRLLDRVFRTGLSPRSGHYATLLLTLLSAALLLAILRRMPGQKLGAAILWLTTPLIAVGLFAFTPDALLAPLWLATLWFYAVAREHRQPMAFAAAGLCAGLAGYAKLPGLLLALSLMVHLIGVSRREHSVRDLVCVGVGLSLGIVPILMLLREETTEGFRMFAHRAALARYPEWTTAAVIRQLTKVALGPLLYLSPLVGVLTLRELRALILWYRGARHNTTSGDAQTDILLFYAHCTFLPGSVLVLLSLASWQSEPHWTAPALLSLLVASALRHAVTSRQASATTKQHTRDRLARWAVGTSAFGSIATFLWVLLPLPSSWRPELDISRELFGFPELVTEEASRSPRFNELVFIAPHWTLCSQLAYVAGPKYARCLTPEGDDLQDQFPRVFDGKPGETRAYLWVRDARFPEAPTMPGELPKVLQERLAKEAKGAHLSQVESHSVTTARGEVRRGRTFYVLRFVVEYSALRLQ
jgi:Dolichyl-phosphate-mannose-protein mannosyltransferase